MFAQSIPLSINLLLNMYVIQKAHDNCDVILVFQSIQMKTKF